MDKESSTLVKEQEKKSVSASGNVAKEHKAFFNFFAKAEAVADDTVQCAKHGEKEHDVFDCVHGNDPPYRR